MSEQHPEEGLTMKRSTALFSVATSILGLMAIAPPAVAATSRPNVVILMSDDQRWDTIGPTLTPNIWDNLVNTGPLFPDSVGTSFTNAFVPNPLCCPSRTSTLTGRYSHTTGVYTNVPPFGGFASFDDEHTIATDFRSAGYRTAMIGKYLNGYNAGIEDYIPPGWDRWFAVNTGAFYNYGAQSDGLHLRYGSQPRDYVTRVLSSQAISFVQGAKAAGGPFLLYYAFTAPHGPAIPDPRDVGRFSSVPLPTPPSYNVAQDPTGAGKPGYILQQPLRDPSAFHQHQLESTYGVDQAVGGLLSVLPSNTIVVYMSDNGMLWGEHRWVGKTVPYNESIRIPMILTSLDGSFALPASWTPDDLVLNVDLRPTLEAAAGVSLSTSVDGLDWGSDPPRDAFVLEHGGDSLSYCGARETNWMYARYVNGFEELYNEALDPYEMDNLASDPIDPSNQVAYDRLSTEASALCEPPPPGLSLPVVREIGGPADQSSAFGNGTWRTWTTDSVAEPGRYNAVASRPHERLRLNASGTAGRAGNFLPGTDTAIYTQKTRTGSDLFFFNMDTHARRKVPGVDTKRNEHHGLASKGYVLFDRNHRVGRVRYTNLLLYNRRGRTTSRLGTWRSARVRVIPGSVGERSASFSLLTRSGNLSYVYDIGTGKRTQIPVPSGYVAYGPTIDEAGGYVYFSRSSSTCMDVTIRRVALPDLGGPQTIVTSLLRGVQASELSVTPYPTGRTDLYFTRRGCSGGPGDIFTVRGVDRL